MTSLVAFIIGGGPRIGWGVATKLHTEGYKVAIGSRNPDTQRAAGAGILPVTLDVTDIKSVENAFETVKQKLGVPSVVVYNAAMLSFPSDPSDPFASIAPETLQKDTIINLIGGYTALRESVAAFKALASSSAPAPAAASSLSHGIFIATGNVTPFQPHPLALTLGIGKSALVHAIQLAILAYKDQGFRFYFASQVTEAGTSVPYPAVKADAHATAYWELINRPSQGNWDVRFLDDGKQVNQEV